MPTPTEMRTNCEKSENVENPRGRKKLVDLEEEESEAWRNIFQERFDRRRTGDNGNQEHFFPFLSFWKTTFYKILLQEGVANHPSDGGQSQVGGGQGGEGELEGKQGEDVAAAFTREVAKQFVVSFL